MLLWGCDNAVSTAVNMAAADATAAVNYGVASGAATNIHLK